MKNKITLEAVQAWGEKFKDYSFYSSAESFYNRVMFFVEYCEKTFDFPLETTVHHFTKINSMTEGYVQIGFPHQTFILEFLNEL